MRAEKSPVVPPEAANRLMQGRLHDALVFYRAPVAAVWRMCRAIVRTHGRRSPLRRSVPTLETLPGSKARGQRRRKRRGPFPDPRRLAVRQNETRRNELLRRIQTPTTRRAGAFQRAARRRGRALLGTSGAPRGASRYGGERVDRPMPQHAHLTRRRRAIRIWAAPRDCS